ncbi:MAG: TetR/AcrR family transcriptional regulator [Solirubrobacterales bacterium]
MTPTTAAIEKRRVILRAAVRVFARRGFHACRVADIADEAGVAYGLVYHYFRSKEQILSVLFTERWGLMLDAIAAAEREQQTARARLEQVARFITDSYRRDPEMMKVIIVEVTRAANSFGQIHLDEIGEAYRLIAEIVREGQERGELRDDVDPMVISVWFYGAIEQLLSGWIFGLLATGDDELRQAERTVVDTLFGGLAASPGA